MSVVSGKGELDGTYRLKEERGRGLRRSVRTAVFTSRSDQSTSSVLLQFT